MNILKLCLREVGEGAHFKSYYCLGVQFSHELFFGGGGGVKCKVLHHIQKTPTPLWDILNNHSLFLHYAFKALGDSRVCTEV